MDVFDALSTQPCKGKAILKCIDMQTTGEPTRIIISGYPDLFPSSPSPLPSTLLTQRDHARSHHDHLRRVLMLEPRGHYDMYGAHLRPNTELVASGEADIGVLFMTNDGYSTMCGHATIALGRLLLDTLDRNIFPHRERVSINANHRTATLRLHAPCGAVQVRVPVQQRSKVDEPNDETSSLSWKSDPTRPVSFISTPSFATGVSIPISIPADFRWPELGDRTSVTVDFSYGGAFYCLISATELGFPSGLLPTAQAQPNESAAVAVAVPSQSQLDLDAFNTATRRLKAAITTNQDYHRFFTHPVEPDLSFLYSIMVVDQNLGSVASKTTSTRVNKNTNVNKDDDGNGANEQSEEEKNSHGNEKETILGAEVGLCFFADQQVDRSPTGSAVAARIALAYAKGSLGLGQKWTYHSLLSAKSLLPPPPPPPTLISASPLLPSLSSQSMSSQRQQPAQSPQLSQVNTQDTNSGAFTGSVVEVLDINSFSHGSGSGSGYSDDDDKTKSKGEQKYPVVKVQVQGYAYYTGCHTFIVEDEDPLGVDGFVFGRQ